MYMAAMIMIAQSDSTHLSILGSLSHSDWIKVQEPLLLFSPEEINEWSAVTFSVQYNMCNSKRCCKVVRCIKYFIVLLFYKIGVVCRSSFKNWCVHLSLPIVNYLQIFIYERGARDTKRAIQNHKAKKNENTMAGRKSTKDN